MPREDLILFLDLETTGSDVEKDEIIEIGMVMLRAEDLTEIGSYSRVYLPSSAAFDRMLSKPVVYEMHKANGLLDEIVAIKQGESPTTKSIDYAWTGWMPGEGIFSWLTNLKGADTAHIPFGGSGVSHFDRPFLVKYIPRLAQSLTYWSYDVGNVRRMFAKLGLPWLPDAKTHRALDDARHHVNEFRYALKAIKGDTDGS